MPEITFADGLDGTCDRGDCSTAGASLWHGIDRDDDTVVSFTSVFCGDHESSARESPAMWKIGDLSRSGGVPA